MSLKTQKKEQRVFYFKEKPSDINYPYPECFYFKIVEYKTNDKNHTIEYVVIRKIDLVFDDYSDVKNRNLLKFSDPYIPESIKRAVKEMEKL